MDLFGKSPRPTFDADCLSELAEEMAKDIVQWSRGKVDHEDCKKDCIDIFEWHYSSDGYELAKEFEDKHYDADAELVDVLDGVAGTAELILSRKVRAWVKEDGIEPQFDVGDQVLLNWGQKDQEGVITGMRKDEAIYLVMIPAEGMSMDDSRRAVVKYERVSAVVNEKMN